MTCFERTLSTIEVSIYPAQSLTLNLPAKSSNLLTKSENRPASSRLARNKGPQVKRFLYLSLGFVFLCSSLLAGYGCMKFARLQGERPPGIVTSAGIVRPAPPPVSAEMAGIIVACGVMGAGTAAVSAIIVHLKFKERKNGF